MYNYVDVVDTNTEAVSNAVGADHHWRDQEASQGRKHKLGLESQILVEGHMCVTNNSQSFCTCVVAAVMLGR